MMGANLHRTAKEDLQRNKLELGRPGDDTLRTFQVPELVFVQPSRMRKRG
jgi:hypothetical protein